MPLVSAGAGNSDAFDPEPIRFPRESIPDYIGDALLGEFQDLFRDWSGRGGGLGCFKSFPLFQTCDLLDDRLAGVLNLSQKLEFLPLGRSLRESLSNNVRIAKAFDKFPRPILRFSEFGQDGGGIDAGQCKPFRVRESVKRLLSKSLRRRRCGGVKWVVGPCCASLCRSDFGGRPTRELLGEGRSR